MSHLGKEITTGPATVAALIDGLQCLEHQNAEVKVQDNIDWSDEVEFSITEWTDESDGQIHYEIEIRDSE